ncbi:Heavy-metal-associated domain (N-terminus) and membrane-bounded cytochrome biogenesis cycZ-like domain, possible membrane copper tolerance protein [Thioalkalivibrio nitratireducens DSM 14787]|uniref:Heavy-metal-associated domain (N-terminus) and membrane-bounded cytochrome biogenesis cycZ-like domain, possible membrane copper tolerance protein n=1 Tax=Thioalkalivibrio nitratireducens (strain DSM 14787 / UNIQEM 213 / ALEN2) TaxID=1255043 RepID=L0DQZ7_THIND|nr:Heavy-metal-associated domain (N-terminus) and membrane-bounded cytochrome biogenesis cycZ-like domain, possible membrane copper tolerance protein [Thioalkalivibrio nitratireducens DSM 14787]
MEPGTLVAAFAVGVLGGVHCLGMCGGIVGAISLSHGPGAAPAWSRLLAYNLGRMTSYVVAGALAGLLGAVLLGGLPQGQRVLEFLAAVFLVLLGLYLAGWWPVLARLERVGGRVWRRIEPLGRRFIPVQHAGQAFAVGGIWGWLPCGLVYSVLVWTLSAGSATDGALLMAAFALGTLPNLMLMGIFAARLARVVRNDWLRKGAGTLLIVYGAWRLAGALV